MSICLLTNHGWVSRQHGAAIRPAGWRLPTQRRPGILPWRLALALALPAQPQRAAAGPPPPLLLLPPRRRAPASAVHILRQQRQVVIRLLVLAVLTIVLTVHCMRQEGIIAGWIMERQPAKWGHTRTCR